MLTLQEIEQSEINLEVAKVAYDQASKRLGDILETKKAYDQKAFTLLSGFLAVTIGFIGGGVAVLKDQNFAGAVVTLWITGSVFGVGALFLMLSLLDKPYGAVASDPQMWLEPGVIDGDETSLATMLAYVTYYHQERIDKSIEANEVKAKWLRRAVITGFVAPLVLLISILFQTLVLKVPSSTSRGSPEGEGAAASGPDLRTATATAERSPQAGRGAGHAQNSVGAPCRNPPDQARAGESAQTCVQAQPAPKGDMAPPTPKG